MNKSFLKGNFLPAYGASFGRLKESAESHDGLPPEKLASRFAERESIYLERLSRYNTCMMGGIVASLIVVILLFRLDIVAGKAPEISLAEQEIVQMEDIIQTRQVERPPPPPRPPVPVEVPDDVVLDEVDLDLDATLDLDMAIADLPPPPPETRVDKGEEEPEVFVVVEEMPEMIGGLAALSDVLVYPPIAQKAEIEGTVIIRVIVDEEGNPTNPEVWRPIHALLDAEAKRAVMLQKFKVARQRGRPVKVYFSVPVRFVLN